MEETGHVSVARVNTVPGASRRGVALAALVAVVAHLAVSNAMAPYRDADPDRLFHLAVSRQWAQHGLPRTLPQVTGLGWDQRFADKEFLFHAVTGLAYAWGGPSGVNAVPVVLGAAVAGVVATTAALMAGPWVGAWATVGWLVWNAGVGHRLHMVRPHVLAMLALALMWLALWRRSRPGCAAAGMLYALSYHAIYVPLGIAALAWGAAWLAKDRRWRGAALAGGGGVLAGVLLNPYFPDNLVMAALHVRVALEQTGPSVLAVGEDTRPLRSDRLAAAQIGLWLAFAVGWLGLRRIPIHLPRRAWAYCLAAATLMFTVLTFLNQRAAEYACPTAVLLVCVVAGALPVRIRLAGLPALAVLLSAPMLHRVWSHSVADPTRVAAALRSAQAIPERAHVFNCDWHTTPAVLWQRPLATVVDVLEPRMLMEANPAAANARDAFLRGLVPDAAAMMADLVHANAVLCLRADGVAALEHNPFFRRIYPALGPVPQPTDADPRVYIIDETTDPFVTAFTTVGTPLVRVQQRISPTRYARYVGLSQLAKPPQCITLTPELVPDTDAAPYRWLLLGGRGRLHVMLNGQPLWGPPAVYDNAALVHVVLGLPQLHPSDVLQVQVCGQAPQTPPGLALGVLTQDRWAQLCAAHNPDAPRLLPHGFGFTATLPSSCLGPVIAPKPLDL